MNTHSLNDPTPASTPPCYHYPSHHRYRHNNHNDVWYIEEEPEEEE
jgi:hypothetical protein